MFFCALQTHCETDLKNFPYDEELYTAALNADVDEAIKKLQKFIVSIKEPLVNFKKFPMRELIIHIICIITFQVTSFNQ
jgi:hypothetical protein